MSFRPVAFPRIIVASCVAGGLVMTLTPGTGLASVPPGTIHQTVTPTYFFYAPTTLVTTTKGMKLNLGVSGSDLSGLTGTTSVTNGLTTTGTPFISTNWSVNAPTSQKEFVATSAGALHINLSSAQSGGVMVEKLAFTKTGSSSATCQSGKETIYRGTLSGRVGVVTSSKSWGNLTAKAETFGSTAHPAVLTVSFNCVPKLPTIALRCNRSSFWSGPTGPSGVYTYEGFSGGTVGVTPRGSLTASRSTTFTVPSPATGYRSDTIVDASPPQIFASHAGTAGQVVSSLAIKTGSPGGSVTKGSATLTIAGPKPTPRTSSCVLAGKKHTESMTTYSGTVSWRNGAPALTANFPLGGPMTVANATNTYSGSITVSTYS